MKTQHLFKAHEQLIKDNSTIIKELIESITTKKEDLKNFNKHYEEYIKNGEDDKADSLFSEIIKTETDIKMAQKKLDTKKPILKSKEIDSAIEVLINLFELPNLYKDDAEMLKSEYIEAKLNLNEIENKIDRLNNLYDNEYQDFVDLFDEYNESPIVKEEFVNRANKKGVSKYAGKMHFSNPTRQIIVNISELNKEMGGSK